ncbi:MAG TPA: RbsD/FucU domain-containing protein [Duganella sp.]|nr:RbsD/FucU domain-containing protein [Duganella sp.]
MLKGIDAALTPELLKVLCEMGHGDEVVVVDANFTAASLGRGKPVIRMPGIDLQRACRALLSVFPLDQSVAQPVAYMKVEHTADGYASGVQRAVIALAGELAAAAPRT